jgi:hypothetical protein
MHTLLGSADKEATVTQLTPGVIHELLEFSGRPCVSLYMPTHRMTPHARENPIRFKNLMRRVREAMTQQALNKAALALAEQIESAAAEHDFWRQQKDALAIFCAPSFHRVVQLQRPVREHVVVSDSFLVKPLIRQFQMADRFQVLCVTQRNVELYEGNQYALDQVALRNVPRSVAEAVAAEFAGQRLARPMPSGADEAIQRDDTHPGSNARHDLEDDMQLERFFRIVDRAVWENHARDAGLPMILCAVSHYHPIFQRITSNQNLLPNGIGLNPDSLTPERLREEAWKLIEPFYAHRVAELKDRYHAAKARQLGSNEPDEVAQAAVSGRVDTVLIEADRHIDGRIDRITGSVERPTSKASEEDLLDDLAETVLRADGAVLIVPPEQMPTDTGVAAIYRY